MAASSMNIRMDSEVKAQAQTLFAQFGLDMTTAINMFLRQSIRERGIPFDLRLPEKPRTLDELSKAEMDEKLARGLADIDAGRYRPADEVFAELEQRHTQRGGK